MHRFGRCRTCQDQRIEQHWQVFQHATCQPAPAPPEPPPAPEPPPNTWAVVKTWNHLTQRIERLHSAGRPAWRR